MYNKYIKLLYFFFKKKFFHLFKINKKPPSLIYGWSKLKVEGRYFFNTSKTTVFELLDSSLTLFKIAEKIVRVWIINSLAKNIIL